MHSKRLIIASLLTMFAFACSSSTTTSDGSSGGTPTGDAGSDTGTGSTASFGFKPSNFDLGAVDFTGVGDLVIGSMTTWEFAPGSGVVGSDNGAPSNYKMLTQSDGSTIVVVTIHSLKVSAGATLGVIGPYPVVIVAEDTIEIDGTLLGSSHFQSPQRFGPGAPAVNSGAAAGGGPGGGSAGSGGLAGAGAGFCGVGGDGATTAGGVGSKGGPSYGNPTLVPLVAGSDGGSAFGDNGAGGGALQLVAANGITVVGVINVSGEGGGPGGVFNNASSQNAGGGGSGGALLLESPTVTVGANATLAANGGGGGGGNGGRGGDGEAVPQAPLGGDDGTVHASFGGPGSGGVSIDGQSGSATPNYSGGGGGGASGRIRINTTSGQSAIAATGIVSPSIGTVCVSEGTLQH